MRAPQAGSLNPLQSEAVVFTSLNQRSAVRLGPSLNPLQSEAVVFTYTEMAAVKQFTQSLNPLQSEAVVFTLGGPGAGPWELKRS